MNKQEQAEKDYLSGMKYKDIAAKYDVSINTVKSWKNRYGWQRGNSKKGASPPKKVHTKLEKVAHKKEDASDELNANQELFCQLVGGQRLPLYRAYMIAFKIKRKSLESIMSSASRLGKRPEINARIVKIQQEAAAKHEWSLDRVIDSLTFVHDEAKADIYLEGLKKGNSDAMMNSIDRITSLLHISDEGKRAKAEADIAQSKANEVNSNGSDGNIVIVDEWSDDDDTDD
ncbi:terminase gpP N-terminus-related DNA-binding protein [Pediococcus pentosaceus]|uniref:terminase gpP N-terminus-related DNA-binding protein n=1 Tax=Pediococcus pentosaceus TaxID=1255 RepID=UPI001F59E9D3|nr:terminase [Pediococcus pentosaceus]MCI2961028.1 terminase [Pediococcus pentosaceus]